MPHLLTHTLEAKMLSTLFLALACSLSSSLVRAQQVPADASITFWPSRGCASSILTGWWTTTSTLGSAVVLASAHANSPVQVPNAEQPLYKLPIEFQSLEIPNTIKCDVTCCVWPIDDPSSTYTCIDNQGNPVTGKSLPPSETLGNNGTGVPFLADARSLLTISNTKTGRDSVCLDNFNPHNNNDNANIHFPTTATLSNKAGAILINGPGFDDLGDLALDGSGWVVCQPAQRPMITRRYPVATTPSRPNYEEKSAL